MRYRAQIFGAQRWPAASAGVAAREVFVTFRLEPGNHFTTFPEPKRGELCHAAREAARQFGIDVERVGTVESVA